MCGILAILEDRVTPMSELRKTAIRFANKLAHRGPDACGVWAHDCDQGGGKSVMIHHRLSITDPRGGGQPFVHNGVILIANAEIYNHRELAARFCKTYPFQTQSDCEVLLALYIVLGPSSFLNSLSLLSGMFAFVLRDTVTQTTIVARDHMGIVPLYYGVFSHQDTLCVASEMKAIIDTSIGYIFPPGCFYVNKTEGFRRWYDPDWITRRPPPVIPPILPSTPFTLRDALVQAVKSHMVSDAKWGILLSGGLDSSLIAAIACQVAADTYTAKTTTTSTSTTETQMGELKRENCHPSFISTFSIGLESSPDLLAARRVAEYLQTDHHEFVYTVQEGIDALENVIKHIETFDVTTCRASVPMYLLARRIKALGFKMVLSGEGADEALGGYLYFHHCPSPDEFYKETRDKLISLHLYDCLRANKSMAAWGIETRVPFLDPFVLATAMAIDPVDKMIHPGVEGHSVEKHVLRRQCTDLLPPSMLWRQKEQFSDGVGYGWISGLKAYAETNISDSVFALAATTMMNAPRTKEGLVYRHLFNTHYPLIWQRNTVAATPSVACSTERAMQWSKAWVGLDDPSGLTIHDVHTQTM